MLLNDPDEHDGLCRRGVHPLQHVDGQAERESSPAPSRNKHDLVERHGIRERAVRPVNRRRQLGAGFRGRVLVQITRKPVAGIDHKLHGLRTSDRERVALELADRRDPHEAVLPSDRAHRLLGNDDLGAAVWERFKGRVVVEGAEEHPRPAHEPVRAPHDRDEDEHDEEAVPGEVGLVVARADEGHQEAKDVRDKEDFVPDETDDGAGKDDAQEAKGRHDAGCYGWLLQIRAHA